MNKPFILPSGKFFMSEMIDQALLGPDHPAAKNVRKTGGNVYPSMASAKVKEPKSGIVRTIGSCARSSYYNLTGTPPSDLRPDPKMERIKKAGEILAKHFVYEQAQKSGIYVADEVSFFDSKNSLSGRYDIMLRLPNGELMGSDVKTISTYKETPHISAGRNGYDALEPRWKDVCQIMCYLAWYHQYGVYYWSLYYLSREFATGEFVFEWANVPRDAKEVPDTAYLTCYSRDFYWKLDWLTWGDIRKRYEMVKKAIADGVPPERDYSLAFSNSKLVEMATAGGSGNQLIPLNKTECEMILNRYHRAIKKAPDVNIDSLSSFLQDRGDSECGYCDYKSLCWFGLPAVPKTFDIGSASPLDVTGAGKAVLPDDHF